MAPPRKSPHFPCGALQALKPRDRFGALSGSRVPRYAPAHDLSTKDRDKGLRWPNKGPKFNAHFDSRYKWGETIIGVSLGAACCLRFFPAKGQTMNGPAFAPFGEFGKGLGASRVEGKRVEIELPRRSIYIMSGPSRTDWEHAISPIEDKSPPSLNWNPGFRRSLTMRTFKWYSNAVLQIRLQKAQTNKDIPAAAALVKRINAQNVFKKGVSTKDMKHMKAFYPRGEEQAQQFAQEIESGELKRLTFTKRESRIYVFQDAGRHLGGASGTSTRAPPRLNDEEMRAARRRRFDPTAAAVKSQEVIDLTTE